MCSSDLDYLPAVSQGLSLLGTSMHPLVQIYRQSIPPTPRPLGSPFHPKGDSAGDEEPVDSDGHICFRNPIEQDTPSHIRARRTKAEVVATLKLPSRSQSLREQLIRRDAKKLRKLEGFTLPHKSM